MKKYLFSLLCFLSVNSLYAQRQPITHVWAWAFSASSLAARGGTDVCTDIYGYVYTVGVIDGTARIGGQQLSDGSFIAKYRPDGICIWSKLLPGGNAIHTCSIINGKDGSLYLNGNINGTSIMGNDTLSNGSVFIAKLDTAGNVLWARSGGNSNDEILLHNLTVDNNGNVTTVANTLSGSGINFGGNVVSGSGPYMVRYNTSGDLTLEKFLVQKGQTDIFSIAADVASNIYASGFAYDTVILDNGTSLVSKKSTALIIKYNTSGDINWVKTTTGGEAIANVIVADKNGSNLYVLGEAQDTVRFDSYSSLPDYFGQLFLAKYDSSGAAIWAKRFGGPGSGLSVGAYNYFAKAIVIDDNQNITIGGNFTDKLMFNGSNILSNVGANVFVAQFDPAGTFNWAMGGGGRINTTLEGMCNTGSSIYTIGTYNSANAVFGYYNLSGNLSTGKSNLFFAQIADVTGIQNTDQFSSTAAVYPNPAHNTITVDHISAGTAIRVVDVAGKVLLSKTAASEKETINIAALLPGIYLLQLADNDTNTKSFRIEKQ